MKFAGREPGEVIDDDSIVLLSEACQGIARLLNRAAMCAAELAAEAYFD